MIEPITGSMNGKQDHCIISPQLKSFSDLSFLFWKDLYETIKHRDKQKYITELAQQIKHLLRYQLKNSLKTLKCNVMNKIIFNSSWNNWNILKICSVLQYVQKYFNRAVLLQLKKLFLQWMMWHHWANVSPIRPMISHHPILKEIYTIVLLQQDSLIKIFWLLLENKKDP